MPMCKKCTTLKRQAVFLIPHHLMMVSLAITCKGMKGEGFMGLNNVHLKLKVNGTAASQRNSMKNTRDREKDRDEIIFL